MSNSDDLLLDASTLKTAGAVRLSQKLPPAERSAFLAACDMENKKPSTLLIVSIFLGEFGVDRFLIGDTVLGLFKLFTFGGCMLWWFIDLFLIMGATRRKNNESAFKIYCQMKL